MRSWWMQAGEPGSVLEMRDTPQPVPAAGQLLVRMRAASLNRGEFLASHGKAGAWKAIGGEGAGEVVAVEDGVTAFKPGDAVMGRCAGAFADYGLMEAAEAMAKPASLSWEEAASVPLTFLVAFDMLVLKGQLQPGEWVLVNGVSSGVGVACLQLAKALGAKVVGTSSSARKLEALKPLGLDCGIATRTADFAKQVMEATGDHGADIVIDTVGGSVFAEDLRCMAFEGRLAIVGHVDRQLHADADLEAIHRRRLTVFGVSNQMRSKAQRASGVPRFVTEVLPFFADGRIKPRIDQVVAFDEVPKAKQRMEEGAHTGKIALRIA